MRSLHAVATTFTLVIGLLSLKVVDAFVPRASHASGHWRGCSSSATIGHRIAANTAAAAAAAAARSTFRRRSTTRLHLTLPDVEDDLLSRALSNPNLRPDVIYIVLYNPSTPQEGLHTVPHPRVPDGSGDGDGDGDAEVLMAFESLDDCVQFAQVVRENGSEYGEPVPTPSSMVQIEAACQSMGLPLMVVPSTA